MDSLPACQIQLDSATMVARTDSKQLQQRPSTELEDALRTLQPEVPDEPRKGKAPNAPLKQCGISPKLTPSCKAELELELPRFR
jgi:hypothetical protein